MGREEIADRLTSGAPRSGCFTVWRAEARRAGQHRLVSITAKTFHAVHDVEIPLRKMYFATKGK